MCLRRGAVENISKKGRGGFMGMDKVTMRLGDPGYGKECSDWATGRQTAIFCVL